MNVCIPISLNRTIIRSVHQGFMCANSIYNISTALTDAYNYI